MKLGNNNLLFLSHPYSSQTPSYGNRDMVKVTANSSIKAGETANSSCWVFTNNHIGTHIDVPYHFDISGKKVGDYSAADWLFTKVGFVEIVCAESVLIGEDDLADAELNPDIEILLIRTSYEDFRFEKKYWNDNPGLSPTLASYLRNRFRNLRCIGFDFISITSWKSRDEGRKSHRAFLAPEDGGMPILAIEDMSLKNISGALDWLIVAPIIMEDGNGAPVTVIANQRK